MFTLRDVSIRHDIDLYWEIILEGKADDKNREPAILNEPHLNTIKHDNKTRAVYQEQAFLDANKAIMEDTNEKTLHNGNTVETSEGFNCSANSS